MTGKKKILCIIGIIALILAGVVSCLFFTGNVTDAAGLVDETLNAENLYSKYALKNYQLDFYVSKSGGWLPWNWGDSIGKNVMYGLYSLTNVLWTLNLYLSNATGYIVQEAYSLDFIGDMADSIGGNIQTLAGVSASGFSADGLYMQFLPWLIVIVGGYVAYHGLVKHEISKAVQGFLNFVLVFACSAAFIAYSPEYIGAVNEFSVDMSTAMLDIGTKITVPGSNVQGGDGVDRIRDSLFSVQIYQPWLLLQYGTTDEEAIGTERIEALLGVSPSDGELRENATITEVEEYQNMNMSTPEVAGRLGMIFFLLIFNLGISVFVFLLTGIMLLSQILFIIFSMYLPISFLISMIPSQQGKWQQAVMKVFNTIMNRAGITMIITVTFCISSMIYSITAGYPFFLIAFLQIVIFAGTFIELRELLGIFSLQSGDTDKLGRRMFYRPYRRMRMGMRRMTRRMRRAGRMGMTGAVMKSASDRRQESSGTRGKPERRNGGITEKDIRPNIGNKIGKKVGTAVDMPNRINDKIKQKIEKVADFPVNAKYAVHSVGKSFKRELAEGKTGRQERQKWRQEEKAFKREEMAEEAGRRKEKRVQAQKRGFVQYQNQKGQTENKAAENGKRKGTGDKWNDLGKVPKGAEVNRSRKPVMTEQKKQTGKTQKNIQANKKNTSEERKSVLIQSKENMGQKKVPGNKLKNAEISLKTASYTPSVKEKDGRQKLTLKNTGERKK